MFSALRGLGTGGLSQTYKRILFDNDETLAACKELENKTIKYWTACTEKMSTPTEEDGPKVENVEQYAGDPMPHLLIYLKGDLKATINVRFAGSVVSAWRCVSARVPRPLMPRASAEASSYAADKSIHGRFLLRTQGANAPKLIKTMTELLEEFKPAA